jgi:hypothetical protein
MQVARRIHRTSLLGLCLLSVPLVHLVRLRPATPHLSIPVAPLAAAPQSPSQEECRAGWRYRARAQAAVNEERYALEAWDPEAVAAVDQGVLRLQLMARDRTGDLRRARAAAERAAALAANSRERYRAVLLLTLIEHDAGDHRAELQHAHRLVALAPRDRLARLYLRRAAICNGLEPLAHSAPSGVPLVNRTGGGVP